MRVKRPTSVLNISYRTLLRSLSISSNLRSDLGNGLVSILLNHVRPIDQATQIPQSIGAGDVYTQSTLVLYPKNDVSKLQVNLKQDSAESTLYAYHFTATFASLAFIRNLFNGHVVKIMDIGIYLSISTDSN